MFVDAQEPDRYKDLEWDEANEKHLAGHGIARRDVDALFVGHYEAAATDVAARATTS